ncbi:hypothetical protein [Actinoplanes sp. DH11]|nr:hypothetical protein [Actinoplanes sp. DH11]
MTPHHFWLIAHLHTESTREVDRTMGRMAAGLRRLWRRPRRRS